MELTKNSIIDIITNGAVNNSALANMYIAHVKKHMELPLLHVIVMPRKQLNFLKRKSRTLN